MGCCWEMSHRSQGLGNVTPSGIWNMLRRQPLENVAPSGVGKCCIVGRWERPYRQLLRLGECRSRLMRRGPMKRGMKKGRNVKEDKTNVKFPWPEVYP